MKWKLPVLLPTMFRWVETVTVSPDVNGLFGMKLPPRPSESGSTLPECEPLCEPRTEIEPKLLVGMPLNVIWVRGGATWLPLIG